MKPIIRPGHLDPFLSLRFKAEKAIRARCSEHPIMRAHDALYVAVKEEITAVRDAIAAAVVEQTGRHGSDSAPWPRRYAGAIAHIRNVLERKHKERELQDALVDSGLLAVTCQIAQEVTIKPTDGYRGMRMDIVLESKVDGQTEIIELKRGSHMLLAWRGQPTQRVSQELMAARTQIRAYGDRVKADNTTASTLEEDLGFELVNPQLRLVAGRRLASPQEYHLLSSLEEAASHSGLQVLIYTWDGFLAELERLLD